MILENFAHSDLAMPVAIIVAAFIFLPIASKILNILFKIMFTAICATILYVKFFS